MKSSRLSLAVLALIGDSSAIDHARSFYLPISQAQMMKDVSADDAGDRMNTADSYDRYDA
jgi:hypothetical protein